MRKKSGVFTLVFLASCAAAGVDPIKIPTDDNQRLIGNNLAMTAESFFNAYMSKDITQRRLAEMYVLGVIASSEGESWCGFEIASPDAVQEQVYISLKRAAKDSPRQRPSSAIISHLQKILPCGKKQ